MLEGYHYRITYWSEGSGVLRYTYEEKEMEYLKNLKGALTTVGILACATAALLHGDAEPAYNLFFGGAF